MAKGEDNGVGYCKTPEHTRFQKGQSGNPSGRPKKVLTHSEIVERELSRRVTITENGTTRRVTKREVIGKALVQKAMKGDRHALRQVMELDRVGTHGTPDDQDGVMRFTLAFPEEEERKRQADRERGVGEDDDPLW
jgi:hypothetical protein